MLVGTGTPLTLREGTPSTPPATESSASIRHSRSVAADPMVPSGLAGRAFATSASSGRRSEREQGNRNQ